MRLDHSFALTYDERVSGEVRMGWTVDVQTSPYVEKC